MSELREAIDRIFGGELEPMLELLADDVIFQVAPGGPQLCEEHQGKEAVTNYFRLLGGMVTFWQLDYTVRGDQVIAWGRESFTVEPCGLEASREFALVFDLEQDRVTRLLVIEDLPAFFRDGRALKGITVFDMVEHLAVSGVSPAANASPVPT